MADLLAKTEIPKTPQIIIGETKLYLTQPLKIGDQDITSLTIQSADKRGIEGIGSSVLLTREASRKKGSEGMMVDKPMMNLNEFDEVSWEKVSGIQFRDESGTAQTIPKENLSLEPLTQDVTAAQDQTPQTTPAESVDASPQPAETPRIPSPAEVAALAEKPVEAQLARGILENIKEDPNVITIVGLKAYEARANDLAERSMQHIAGTKAQERAESTNALFAKTKESIKTVNNFVTNTLWKQSIGGIYFQEKARQYYMDMLQAAETPFAESSIRVAEARAKVNYDKMLADKNFLGRMKTKAIDWFKDGVGARTTVQKLALEEIRAMKEAGELTGTKMFDREAKAVRLRFSQDMDAADKFVRKNLGEKLEILDPEKDEHKPLVEGVQSLMKRYATGEISDKAAFDAESKEFFKTTLKDSRPDIFAEAELYSSSLYEAAETLRAKASHEGGLANVDADIASMKIRLGLGQMGEATSLERNKVSKGVEKVMNVFNWIESKNLPLRPILFNEATVGSAVALALSLKIIPQSMFSATARTWGGFAGGVLAGGTFGAFREYHKLQREYLTHVREREVGTTFGEHLQKRKWFEKYVVKQRSADELVATLQSSLYTPDGALKDTLTADELRTSFATLADIQARKTLSETALQQTRADADKKRIGLIQFSARENIESQRTALDIVSNKSLNDLASYIQAHEAEVAEVLGGNSFPDFMVKLTTDQTMILKEGAGKLASLDDPVKNILGLISSYAPEADIVKRRFPFASNQPTDAYKALGIDAIFAEFKKEARVEAVKYGVKSGVIGAGVGVVLHEAFQLMGGVLHGDSLSHTTEAVQDAIKNQTEASTFAPGNTAAQVESITLHPSSTNIWHSDLGDYQLPEELEIVSHVTGGPDERVTSFDAILHAPGPLGRDITLGDDLSAEQLMEKLKSIDGINVTEGVDATGPTTRTVGVAIPDLVTKYGDQIHTQLPEGYHFNHVTPTGHPDTWQLLDANNKIIASGLDFNKDGSLANLDKVESQLAAHGLKLDTSGSLTIRHPGAVVGPEGLPVPAGSTIASAVETTTTKAVPTEMMTLQGDDMGDGGLWEYFLKKTNGENSMATTNGMKNLFRLYTYEQNNANITLPDGDIEAHLRGATLGDQSVQEFNIARIPSDATITLPENIFGQEGIDKFQEIQKQALLDYQHTLAQADVRGPGDAIQYMYDQGGDQKIEAIVLKLGYQGIDAELPTDKADLALLYEKMGAAAPTEVITAPVTPVVATIETPVDPVVLHPVRIFSEGSTATPGVISADKAIEVPYLTPTQVEEVAAAVEQAQMSPAEKLQAGYDSYHASEWASVSTTERLFDNLPLIPIFIPTRRGLESARSPELPVTNETTELGATMLAPFGVDTNLITQEQLSQRASPRLNENPQAQLDPQQEVSWYTQNLPAEEQTLNAEFMAQEPQTMSPTTRAAVIIPVSNNQSSLSQTLTNYLAQTDKDGTPLDPKTYELVVYNAMLGETPTDELKTMVDQWKADHPDHALVYFSHTYAEKPNDGRLKRDITNAVMQRIANRIPAPAEASNVPTQTSESPTDNTLANTETIPVSEPLPDVAIINDPGMVNKLPETYLSSMMDGLKDRDMVVGKYDEYAKEVYEQIPMAFAPYRAYEIMDALTRYTHGDNVPNTVSGNNAIRASTLAAVGGYNGQTINSEDREMAWMIQKTRKNTDAIGTHPDAVTYDPKQFLYAHIQQAGTADASGPLDQNEIYKNMTWQEMGEKVKSIYTKEMLEQDLTNMYNGLYPALRAKEPEAFDRNFNFTLDSLGLAHEIADGKVTILDESKLASAITGIPDIESFGKVTAEKFAEQDKTSREILANMAGQSGETAANTAAATPDSSPETKTLQSNLSSPELELDVIKNVTPTETLTPPAEAENKPTAPSDPQTATETKVLEQTEPLPTGVNDRIDYVLEKNQTEKSAKVAISPGELMDYLKTNLDLAGTRVTEGSIKYTDGKIHMQNLKAKGLFGEYTFSADLISDPQKGLVVDPNTLNMKLPLLARPWTKWAHEQASQLSQLMLNHIDGRSNPIWKASRIDLVGEKLEIKFNKKI